MEKEEADDDEDDGGKSVAAWQIEKMHSNSQFHS